MVNGAGGRRGCPSPSRISEAKPLRWRVLVDRPLPGALNMARDHGLALALAPGTAVLRLYQWDRPTVSFGRNEPAVRLYSRDEAVARGVGFVRRPTGGRAVLHHKELTYGVIFPTGALGGLKEVYGKINRGLLAGIRSLGVPAQLASPDSPSLPPDAGPCFREPSQGEVTALGRKLIGSAQVRIGRSILQHGSIILDGDQGILATLRGEAAVPASATLRSVLGRMPGLDSVRDAIRDGLAGTLGGAWEEGDYTKDEKMAASELEAHYEDEEWTWRL